MDVKDEDTVGFGKEGGRGARPMKVVVAEDGSTWLCDADADVDPGKDLGEQGCWRCVGSQTRED